MFRSLAKKAYYAGASAVRLDCRRLRELSESKLVAILNLHRVSPESNHFWPPMQPHVFAQLLAFVSKNFSVCSIGELANADSDKPLAVLSFDDGYYDFVEFALPLLRKYGLPSNMNVIPQCAISGRPIWNVQLYDFLNRAPLKQIQEIRIPGFSGELRRDSPDAKVRFGVKLSAFLKKRPRSERVQMWESIEPLVSDTKGPQTRLMTTNEIRQIRSEVEVGVHSFSHESMGFEDMDFFLDDLQKCREYFDRELGLPMSIYAFPNGSFRDELLDPLRANDVKHILLVGERFADPKSDVLNRVTMHGETGSEVRMRSLGL
jgi:peptidoglycan/xylan/chitin deacetylase (PgdA/CDA1 family)